MVEQTNQRSSKTAEDKIARICWNTEGWRKPSGPRGKTKNKKAYESRFGFGHEEWLLDVAKLINGWHYAHLQPVALHRETYRGRKFNISLYSINEETRGRWWIGRILDVEVVTASESRKIYRQYERNGWLKEMQDQLHTVGAIADALGDIEPEDFVAVRFDPGSIKILDTPMPFSAADPAITSNHYKLLNQKLMPRLRLMRGFSFSPGHKNKKEAAESTYEAQSSSVDLLHNKIQANMYQCFAGIHGEENVGTELETGYGGQIDLAVKDTNGDFVFYEIKTSYSVRLCIREALGQLMEYAHYPGVTNAKKLVIVSPNPITADAKEYLHKIRERFGVPVYYQRYDTNEQVLEKTEY